MMCTHSSICAWQFDYNNWKLSLKLHHYHIIQDFNNIHLVWSCLGWSCPCNLLCVIISLRDSIVYLMILRDLVLVDPVHCNLLCVISLRDPVCMILRDLVLDDPVHVIFSVWFYIHDLAPSCLGWSCPCNLLCVILYPWSCAILSWLILSM